MEMQHGHAARLRCMDMHSMDMQHENMGMQHKYMDMQHGHGHAIWILWTCNIDMRMHHGYKHIQYLFYIWFSN
jgi:hypothetical protein